MVGVINGVMTILALVTFVGIVWWAWSAGRVDANRQASMLPFALPEEFKKDKNTGESYE